MNMYKIYLKQAWALLKENKLLSGVSIFGTALAICMIMVIVIVWQMRTANYSPEDYRDRMMYVSDTRASYERIKADTDYSFGVTYDYRVRMALMAFLGLNILLCVMGTFWYRVRMRRGEIGLRMAIGSPREEIRSQMAREGICLLLMATPLALLIEAQFVMVGFLDIPKGTLPELYWPAILPLRFLLVNILTWILLAIVILLAVWLPASKAAEMEPAEALRYDG